MIIVGGSTLLLNPAMSGTAYSSISISVNSLEGMPATGAMTNGRNLVAGVIGVPFVAVHPRVRNCCAVEVSCWNLSTGMSGRCPSGALGVRRERLGSTGSYSAAAGEHICSRHCRNAGNWCGLAGSIPRMPLADGSKFAGFTIVRLLGSGGMPPMMTLGPTRSEANSDRLRRTSDHSPRRSLSVRSAVQEGTS